MNQVELNGDDEQVNELLGFGRKYRNHAQGRPDKTEATHRRSAAARVLQQLTDSRRVDEMEDAPSSVKPVNIADVQHGVTVGWLAQVFAMDPTTVRKKLRDCPPVFKRKAGYVYDLKIAAQYLVKPVFDAEQYIKSMKPSELPTHLQDTYWSAMRKKQQWEADAGHLWRTEAVVEVFGDVFQTIKFAMQLWPDNVEQALGLSSEQRKMLIGMADSMQEEIHKKLIDMPSLKRTPSLLTEGIAVVPKIEMEEDDDLDVDLV